MGRDAAQKRRKVAMAFASRFVSTDELDRLDTSAVVPPAPNEDNRHLLRLAAEMELCAPLPVCTVCDEFVCAGLPERMAFEGDGERSRWIDSTVHRLSLDELPDSFFQVLRAECARVQLPVALRQQYDISSLFPTSTKQVRIRTCDDAVCGAVRFADM